jgi:putative membrane protein insertion efficiency factor
VPRDNRTAVWGRRVLLGGIAVYKVALAPFLGGACRYLPSCSDYATEAIQAHGAWRGLGLAARRVGRCHPWGGHGHDPVPPARLGS